MGRKSLSTKAKKRRNQKTKKKMRVHTDEFPALAEESTSNVNTDDVQDGYGIDMKVLEMQIEDGFRELDQEKGMEVPQYSTSYLL